MSVRIMVVSLVFAMAASVAGAQVTPALPGVITVAVAPGQAGFSIENGTVSVGDLCGQAPFSRMPDAITASPGDTMTLRIAGAPSAPYLLLISAGSDHSVSVPNIMNELLLDDPVVVTLAGTLDELSPTLGCPPARETLTGAFPLLPVGFHFVLQAVTMGAGWVAAFTGAIGITVV